MVAEVENGF